jgi:hypothetical protein
MSEMNPTTILPITPAASPRKIPRVIPRSSEPGSEVAVRSLSRGDRNRAEAMRRALLGEYPKSIAVETGMSLGYVYRLLQEQGLTLMPVTAAERAAVMAARKGAT